MPNTLAGTLRALGLLYQWADTDLGHDLDAFLESGAFLTGSQIDSLVVYLRTHVSEDELARMGPGSAPTLATFGRVRGGAFRWPDTFLFGPALAQNGPTERIRPLADAEDERLRELVSPLYDAEGRVLLPFRFHPDNPFEPQTRLRNWLTYQIARSGQGFEAARFGIDWQRKQATCPIGRTSISWNPAVDKRTNHVMKIKFSGTECQVCPSRTQCLNPQRRPKYLRQTLTVRPEERTAPCKPPANASGPRPSSRCTVSEPGSRRPSPRPPEHAVCAAHATSPGRRPISVTCSPPWRSTSTALTPSSPTGLATNPATRTSPV